MLCAILVSQCGRIGDLVGGRSILQVVVKSAWDNAWGAPAEVVCVGIIRQPKGFVRGCWLRGAVWSLGAWLIVCQEESVAILQYNWGWAVRCRCMRVGRYMGYS